MDDGGLPAEWEALSHSARVRKVIELGRQSRTRATAERLLRGWRAGGFTQRLLATFACHGSRDSGALLELTADPSRMVARAALAVLCDVGDDDSLLAALRMLPPGRWKAEHLPALARVVRDALDAGDLSTGSVRPVAVRPRDHADLHAGGGGSWLNRAESMQRVLKRRALDGQHPATPEEIIAWFEAVARHWYADPTPFEWGGKRAARRKRQRERRRRLGGSGAQTRQPVGRKG